MSEIKHSPEPWFIWEGHSSVFTGEASENTRSAIQGHFTQVADCEQELSESYPGFKEILDTGDEEDIEEFERAVNAANARRIVACVNACAGIPTEDLERWDRADMVKRLGDMCDIEDDAGPVAFALTTLALLVGLRKSDIGIPEGAWELAEETLKFRYLKPEGADKQQ